MEGIDNGGWISVKDKMPENEQLVLGYTPVDGYMFVGYHIGYHRTYGDFSDWYIITAMRSTRKVHKRVTHWRPLPSTEGLNET
jgi:hypothetical protein